MEKLTQIQFDIESLVTNGLMFKDTPAGPPFPLHRRPENAIAVQEHLGNIEAKVDSDFSGQDILDTISWARNLLGRELIGYISPESTEDTIRVIDQLTKSRRDFLAFLRISEQQGYKEGKRAGMVSRSSIISLLATIPTPPHEPDPKGKFF